LWLRSGYRFGYSCERILFVRNAWLRSKRTISLLTKHSEVDSFVLFRNSFGSCEDEDEHEDERLGCGYAALSRNWWHNMLNANELYKKRLYQSAR